MQEIFDYIQGGFWAGLQIAIAYGVISLTITIVLALIGAFLDG